MTTIPASAAPASPGAAATHGTGGQDGAATGDGLFASLLGNGAGQGAGKGAGQGGAGADAEEGADPRGKPRRAGTGDAADALIASLVPLLDASAQSAVPAGAAALLAGQPGMAPATPPATDATGAGDAPAAGAAAPTMSPTAGNAALPGTVPADGAAAAATPQAETKGKATTASGQGNRLSPGIAEEGKADGKADGAAAAQPNAGSAPSQVKAAAEAIAGQLLNGRAPGESAPDAAGRPAQPATVEALPPLPSHAAAHYAPRIAAETAAMRAHVPAGQMAAQMADPLVRVAGAGGGEFHIDLSPPELGRVHVVAGVADGQVSLDIQVDNSDALMLLRRDMHQLERALGDAGLKLDTANLQFSLRGDDQSRGFMASGQGGGGQQRQDWSAPAETPPGDSPQDRPRLSIDGVVDVIV